MIKFTQILFDQVYIEVASIYFYLLLYMQL